MKRAMTIRLPVEISGDEVFHLSFGFDSSTSNKWKKIAPSARPLLSAAEAASQGQTPL